jgi:hypothetical protein
MLNEIAMKKLVHCKATSFTRHKASHLASVRISTSSMLKIQEQLYSSLGCSTSNNIYIVISSELVSYIFQTHRPMYMIQESLLL